MQKIQSKFAGAQKLEVTNGVTNVIEKMVELGNPFISVKRNGRTNHLMKVTHMAVLGNTFRSKEIGNLGQLAQGTTIAVYGIEDSQYNPMEGVPSKFLADMKALMTSPDDSPVFDLTEEPVLMYFVKVTQVKGGSGVRKDATALSFTIAQENNAGAPFYLVSETKKTDSDLSSKPKVINNLVEDKNVTKEVTDIAKNLFLELYVQETAVLGETDFTTLDVKAQGNYPLHRLFNEGFVQEIDRTTKASTEGETEDTGKGIDEQLKEMSGAKKREGTLVPTAGTAEDA